MNVSSTRTNNFYTSPQKLSSSKQYQTYSEKHTGRMMFSNMSNIKFSKKKRSRMLVDAKQADIDFQA